ncbi:MAG TPA: ATP-binding cassette domain-containing protein, partial [Thermoanaerobaculia bacterium]
MADILAVREVVKTFGDVRAVDGVSFAVRRGTITGLLGRNGAGKTSTIRMITGIFLPDSGSIEWLGEGNTGSAEFRDRIGYLPEERGLYKQMKIIELLLFLAEIKGHRAAAVRPTIDKWLERFELTDKRDAKVEELSKGNQQKVQLIGTLLHDPELIILDEPQSGLDPVNMVLVRNLLTELRREGKTILLSTHMMAEA